MKLESIDLTNFLSHEATHWEPNGAKLATIVGPNGAGKSALLDGLLYALYDAARGRTDELVKLGASDMAAEVTFAFAGARYRVTRGRTTRSGGKSYLELHIEQANGTWRPLTADSIRETQAAIEALLRLDAATFTTAAFLRQGDADAEARSALARLAQDQAERDRITKHDARLMAQLGLLRRLVTAFGVTGIPARIIESVLPELTSYAQELLDQLRPGMELSIRAQRAKRDGKGIVEALDLVVRDGAGERSLALFSGGERMSVSLALAVGLSRLVARRAGTAIRTLVIDEPDGLDAEARRAFGSALRVLAHHGELERVVVVSHHEDLAEVGDAIYRVSKGPGGSVIEQVQ